mgnify:CR=1 FL=1
MLPFLGKGIKNEVRCFGLMLDVAIMMGDVEMQREPSLCNGKYTLSNSFKIPN